MPRNGSGTYSRNNGTFTGSNVWAQDMAANVKITTSRHDSHDQDIADAITASLAKDGQTTPTANLPMGGYKHTNVAAASARTDYARASQLQDSSLQWLGSTGGSSNAYTGALSPAITAYTAGQRFTFIANHTNTGATTLNLNSVGAANVRKGTGSTVLEANDIVSSRVYTVEHNGSDFVLLNPSRPVLSGALFVDDVSLFQSTSDGSDNKSVNIGGGGAIASSRGAYLRLLGNEFSTGEGYCELSAGNTTSGNSIIALKAPGSNGQVAIATVGLDRWSFQNDGDLANDGTNGGNIVFSKAGTGVVSNITNVSTAGSSQSDATQLSYQINNITTASNFQGVKLPSTIVPGAEYKILNHTAATVYVYPSTGHNFKGSSANASATLGVQQAMTVIGSTSSEWVYIRVGMYTT